MLIPRSVNYPWTLTVEIDDQDHVTENVTREENEEALRPGNISKRACPKKNFKGPDAVF